MKYFVSYIFRRKWKIYKWKKKTKREILKKFRKILKSVLERLEKVGELILRVISEKFITTWIKKIINIFRVLNFESTILNDAN